MGKEWYLLAYEQKPYLHKKALSFQPFSCDYGEHDHCELCWARFSMSNRDLHAGYYERNSRSWICSECYSEFNELFGWQVEDAVQ